MGCGCDTAPDCGCEGIVLPEIHGENGVDGLSTYQLWLQAGNVGSISDFLNSQRGTDGLSAYQVWLSLGNSGTEQDFINSLIPPVPPVSNGIDGTNSFGTITTGFTQPSIASIVTVGLSQTPSGGQQWPVEGQVVFIAGAGYYRVNFAPVGDSVTLMFLGWPNSATTGTVIPSGRKIGPAGERGPAGLPATPLPPIEPDTPVVNEIPTGAPPPGQSTQIFVDDDTGISYVIRWNGAVWVIAATLTGAAGAQWLFEVGNPNTTQPAVPIDTVYVDIATSAIYQKTGATTWSLRVTLNAPLFSLGDNEVVHDDDSSPAVLNLGLPYTRLLLQDDVELDYGAIPFNAEWIFELRGDGGTRSIDFTPSKWALSTSAGISMPNAVEDGDVVQIKCRYMQVSTGVSRMVVVEVVDTQNELSPLGGS